MAIRPVPGELTSTYWAHAKRHELVVQGCEPCGWIWHPPLPRCPHCHTAELNWYPVSGRGTVYTFTVVTHATHVLLAGRIPYVVAIVELAEGPKMVANIHRCVPERVHIGLPVRVIFEEITEEITLPQFVPDW